MIADLIDLCIKEVNKPKNQKKINKDIIEPVVSLVLEKIKPFAFWALLFVCLTISMMLCILFILIFKN